MKEYESFLQSKIISDKPSGFDCDVSGFNKSAFDWQCMCAQWGLRRGRAGFFEAPGLGKTLQALMIGHEIRRKHSRAGIMFAPLCVANQTVREAAKFGFEDVKYVRHQSECEPMKIHVANYEMMEHFDPNEFYFVEPDESSIMKSKTGHYKTKLCEEWSGIPFRFCFTATPSPNDYAELGNHAEFLGVMSRSEMECTFFYHDGGETSKWKLMPHAEEAFWEWVASWSLMIRTPSDIGFSDEGYILPPLTVKEHFLSHGGIPQEGFLPGIAVPAFSLKDQQRVKRATVTERCEAAARQMLEDDRPHVAWTELNDEGELLEELVPGLVNISGADSMQRKEEKILAFCNGDYTKLATKASICGFGLNLQFCSDCSTVNVTHSAEDMYQYLRRFLRFGQKNRVTAHLFLTESEMPILDNVKRKQLASDVMSEKVVGYMRNTMIKNVTGSVRQRDKFEPKMKMELPKWIK